MNASAMPTVEQRLRLVELAGMELSDIAVALGEYLDDNPDGAMIARLIWKQMDSLAGMLMVLGNPAQAHDDRERSLRGLIAKLAIRDLADRDDTLQPAFNREAA